jgi:AraC-like DNA-binding protein
MHLTEIIITLKQCNPFVTLFISWRFIMYQRNVSRGENFIYNLFPIQSFIDCNIIQCGWEACTPTYSFGPAARNHYLFHYILSGKGVFSAVDSKGKNHTYNLKQGQGFLICPSQQSMYVADKINPWEYTWVEFDGLKAQEFLNLAGLNLNNPIYNSDNEAMENIMRGELLHLTHHSSESMLNLTGHLYLFLDALQKSSVNRRPLEKGNINNFYVEEAIAFIENNYQYNITVEDIAIFCNLSRSYFSKVFKEITHSSPQDFLIRYRLGKACELLENQSLSVTEVGVKVGYQHPLRFSRAFKNAYGVSPREWRYNNVPKTSH